MMLRRYHSIVLGALLAIFVSPFATVTYARPTSIPEASREVSREASPSVSPAATPAGNGCDALEPYFQQMADLILPNEGLAILKTVNNDVLALTGTQATNVITSLDDLIRRVRAITPPPAVSAYHLAYIDLVEWYRDMTATRDLLSHQRLINGDKRIVPAIGRAVHTGQTTCGAGVWNAAREAAFPSKP
ncbi:MAG: hypothetical protein ACR2OU_06430 [Thermomicrobiales bacterium]